MSTDLNAEHFRVACQDVTDAMTRPHVLMRPALSKDGDQWCALYGEDLQTGCAGFGDTPSKAMAAFDQAWWGDKGRSNEQ